jgi:hypothetical protein
MGGCSLPNGELGVIASSLTVRGVFIFSAVRTPFAKFRGSLCVSGGVGMALEVEAASSRLPGAGTRGRLHDAGMKGS